MKKFDVLIFDLDNTLIDFSKSETLALPTALKEHNIECTEERVKKYQEINRTCWQNMEKGLFTKDVCVTLRFKMFLDYFDIEGINPKALNESFLEQLTYNVPIMPGSIEVLEKFKDNHLMVMMTNGIKHVQEAKIKKSRLNKYFDFIIISDDVGHNKPDIKIFEYMEDKIGHYEKSKMLIIGDSLGSDIEGGINYGIKTCFFNPKLISHNMHVDYEIKNLRDLLEIV